MRGTSASSLDAVLASVADAQGDAEALGTELFQVARTLDTSRALRRVLTDPSTESSAKVALVADLFGAKIGAGTSHVLATAASSRWSSGRDIVDAIEIAGVEALSRAAETSGDLDRVESELFEVGRVVTGNAQLRAVLSDRNVTSDAKGSLLADVFGGKVAPATIALVTQAASGRSGSFEKAIGRYAEQVASRRGRLVAEVRVAFELDDDQRDALAQALRTKYDSDVQVNYIVDPALVGGVAVSIGDDVVDATISHRLAAARRQLAG